MSPPGPVDTYLDYEGGPWTDAEREDWEQAQREAADAKADREALWQASLAVCEAQHVEEGFTSCERFVGHPKGTVYIDRHWLLDPNRVDLFTTLERAGQE